MTSARSRQFTHLQQRTLERLQAHVPAGCPLTVQRLDAAAAGWATGGFKVTGPGCECISRAQVVLAFIDGFVAAWQSMHPSLEDQLQTLRRVREAAQKAGLEP
jgi:hypothetical protein